MVECKNLSVKAGKKLILDDISFRAEKSKITVIIGMNGSGKTTLLRAISSNIPYYGEITIEGESLKKLTPKQRALYMASMSQSLPNVPVNVKNLVSFGRQPYTGLSGILSQDDKEQITAAIEECGISELTDKRADKLSGGEKRKAFLAMMLAQNTPLLLLDEPTANLDIPYQKYITELLKKRRDKGNTILCVLHDINFALETADKILLIDKGRLVFDGTPDEMKAKNIPEDFFELKQYYCYDDKGNKGVIYK